MSLFNDRRHAGQLLASALVRYSGRTDVLVLALPRGGVPVAYEVARQLAAPLDVIVVRKLGVPGDEELAMGALASGGICVLNQDVVRDRGISKEAIFEVTRTEHRELSRREQAYRGERPVADACGKTAILIDDGLATGATMRAAIRALRQHSPARVIAAVPVAAPETCAEMSEEADEMVCAATPEPFEAVGVWYRDFAETSDEQVRELLVAASRDQVYERERGSAGAHRA
ncbi:MAG TPA: phosphoribosyltransferase [Conexibacter sp.]|nr:phosphoribosyltransferase [Conexibacter sp.]